MSNGMEGRPQLERCCLEGCYNWISTTNFPYMRILEGIGGKEESISKFFGCKLGCRDGLPGQRVISPWSVAWYVYFLHPKL